jgi:hypothetical protein
VAKGICLVTELVLPPARSDRRPQGAGGSGSTLIAAERTGRKAFLMELDTLYADTIVARWEQFTGKKAERVAA